MVIIYNEPEHPEYDYNDTIFLDKIAPGAYAEKIITITGKNNISENQDYLNFYKIGIAVDENTFSEGAITYQLTRLSEVDDISEMAFDTEETTHKYKVKISFPETYEDQSEDMLKRFAAHIVVSGNLPH